MFFVVFCIILLFVDLVIIRVILYLINVVDIFIENFFGFCGNLMLVICCSWIMFLFLNVF